MKLKMKRTSQFAWKKITYCQILNFRFLTTTFFLIYVGICQNSDEIKATDPHNVKDVLFVSLYIYLQIEINHRTHHYTPTLNFTKLLVKL